MKKTRSRKSRGTVPLSQSTVPATPAVNCSPVSFVLKFSLYYTIPFMHFNYSRTRETSFSCDACFGAYYQVTETLKSRVADPIRIGSGFNRVCGSGSGFGIRIRIQEGKNDPQK
jgi:hypothetical protein